MPLGSPTVVGPVTPCCERIRVRGQFSDSRVRLFVEGDPKPVGELVVPWSDYSIPVDRSRLLVGKRLVATQELDGAASGPSPVGVVIEPVAYAEATFEFVKTPYACGRSVLLRLEADPKLGATAGSRIEIWQGSRRLGAGSAIGNLCRVDFDLNQRVISGSPLQAYQYICTSGSPMTTTSEPPLLPPGSFGTMPAVELVESEDGVSLLVECARLIKVRTIVPGAALRLLRDGTEIFNAPTPSDEGSVFIGRGFAAREKITASQSMPECEFFRGLPDEVAVKPLTSLPPPRLDGPLCGGARLVTVSRLIPGSTLTLFADGAEIGRWEASDVTISVDLQVPSPPATITAVQELCGHKSAPSRGYTAATKGSGRWFVVEDAAGNDLKADAFAVHAALAGSGKIVLFSGDQFNPIQNKARPQDIDHAQLFDCQTLGLQKIHAPASDVFCCGHAFLPDGRLVVAGGTERFPLAPDDPLITHHDHFPGLTDTWLFQPFPAPFSSFWSKSAGMHAGRWYPTLLTLRDGRVLALSGHPEQTDQRQRHNNNTMEVFDPATGWTSLGDSEQIVSNVSDYLYPRLHVLPGGDVFSSSPLLSGRSARWSPGSGTKWTDVAPPPGNYSPPSGTERNYHHFSVLLPLLPEKDDEYRAMVAVGGYGDSHVIDFGTPAAPNPAPSWRSLGARPGASGRVRLNSSAVILPTAEVLVIGGVQNLEDDNNTKVLKPELLRRTARDFWQWSSTRLAPATVARNYHSTALLMPDGRVWTAGGNRNGSAGGANVRHLEMEIYEPWYCCLERPSIYAWPKAVHAGQLLLVRIRSKDRITALALLRAGSATHAFNPDQRYVGLRNVALESKDLYVGQVPGSDIAIPGFYLLFAVRARTFHRRACSCGFSREEEPQDGVTQPYSQPSPRDGASPESRESCVGRSGRLYSRRLLE